MTDLVTPVRCTHCGMRVVVRPDPTPAGGYSAWCSCALVSKYDPNYRPVGHGRSEGQALENWLAAGAPA